MRRLLPFAAVAALSSAATAAVVVLPALAEGDRGRSYSVRASDRPFADELGRFARCMREHGFDLDGDVTVRVEGDRVTVDGEEVDADAFREAERACGGPPFRALRAFPPLRDLPPLGELPSREELREQRDAFLADVAKRLGVDVGDLKDALRDAAVARIDALEREGKLDEAHADALRERARDGRVPFLHGPGLGALHVAPIDPGLDPELEPPVES